MIVKEHSTGSDYEPIEEGLYPAICVTVAGIGPQDTPWGVKEKLILTFELPTVRREWTKDGETQEGPAHLSNTYTASISPNAALRGVLEGWRGRPFTPEELHGFDLVNILGKPCQVLIKHNTAKDGRVFANIAEILKPGKEAFEPEHDLIHFDPGTHTTTSKEFAALPDWIANKVNLHFDEDSEKTPFKPDIEVLEEDDIPF